MPIKIEVYDTKITFCDSKNSIVYNRFSAERFSDFYTFRRRIERYMAENTNATYADIMTIAYASKIVASVHRRDTTDV